MGLLKGIIFVYWVFIVIKYFKELLMLIIFTIVSGCSNEPQYTCGFDPALYKTKDGLLVSFKDASIEPNEFVAKIEEFGLKNNFCIANTSRDQESMDRYLVNIQIVKSDYSFYVFGTKKYNFRAEMKNVNANMNIDIEKFCKLIYSHIDTDKIEHYYDTSKLCE